MKKRMSFVFLFVGLFLSWNALAAQEPVGKIIGTVTEEDGSPLPGVSVVATSPSLIGQATSTTDGKGVYRLLSLPAGTYKITFSLPGFKSVVQEAVGLAIEKTLVINVQMAPGKLEEEVTVVGNAPLIDVKSTTQGMTLNKTEFSKLPRGRNYDSLITVIPGVSNEASSGGTSVDGASGLENMYYMDGMNTSDLLLGNLEQQAAFEFMEEVQVKSSGYQAEFGGSLGGVVNVITRSGGNEFHGEAIGYYEGSALTGKERDTLRLNPFNQDIAEYVNYQDLYGKDKINRFEGGFSLGGRILKDRIWFFGAVLPVFRNTTRTVDWLSGDIPESLIEQKYSWYNLMGKITAQPTKNLRLAATFVNNTSKYLGDLPSRDGGDDSSFPWEKVGFSYPDWTATLTADLVLGNNLMLALRGGYYMTNTNNQKLKPSGIRYYFGETNAVYPELVAQYPDQIRAADFESYSWDAGYETKKLFYSRASANMDISYYFNLAGEHTVKAGLLFVRLKSDLDNTFPNDEVEFYWDQEYVIYGQEEHPYKGKYGYYVVRYPESRPPGPDIGRYGKIASYRTAFYLQDSWTIANKLTLNFGLRAEREDVPSYSDIPEFSGTVLTWDFFDKLAPRFGVIYDVFGDTSLKLFGSYAIYYDVLKLALADGAYGAVRDRYNFYTLDDPEWWTYGNGNYPGTYINRTDEYLPSFNETDKKMKAMSQREISFGGEKKITNDLSISARFVRKSLRHAIEDLGIATPGGTIWWIGNPGYGVTLTEKHGGVFDNKYPDTPKARREYEAINIALDKRFSNNWMAGLSYTWSRLWGNYSGLALSSHGQLYPNETMMYDIWFRQFDKTLKPLDGLLWTDRTHFFKFFGSYTFDFGLTLGLVANARSGVPISRIVEAPDYWFPDGLETDGRTPFLFTTDLYAEEAIRLGKNQLVFSVNISNLFNSATAQQLYSQVNRIYINVSDDELLTGTWDYRNTDYVADPRFLMKYDFLPPISARLGVKFIF
jgi:Carboxypeptidase regulatory-like domain/TonB dependent receptor-like, beta-barrel